ncbi:3-isopropylmalate/(R)-2-methylmalate dehydratase small subunit [Desulfobotulus alkaliphilus]|uniref:3-isopropylmalate dehydratase n=1 Tax=Desulfobotulus alkaliphilus TaxID=622671 RepID=A0A562S981_9BACT|nr:3-isopropylmalate dehydratase small subunit [Desulfobotulus alkaliphilus]TWI77314.1 3-isopropylmalate/(R)-2-methylmalate dehydratase small subunit [Desulfobotulus alkaliphilus]
MKSFDGKVAFLDRSDINTDEIIPARYLTEITKEALKPFLMEDLNMEGFHPASSFAGASVVVSRANFGCGSSREHAPWAFEVNGIYLVIAESFARIFRQNMFNCGMMAVELPKEDIDVLFSRFSGKETFVSVDLEKGLFVFKAGEDTLEIGFSVSEFDKSLVKAGGWVDFADKNY